jgi:long-chain acyl-CoA synthetase
VGLSTAIGEADTFAKLLARNAAIRGARPAFRHKDRGIWRHWSWSEVNAIVRAYAIGLSRLGLKRGDSFSIIGGNRPRLYWSFMAAQALGAIPVPVYADAIADEMSYVLSHAEVTSAAVQDQEQVDKLLSVAAQLPDLTKAVYDEPRGLRDYDPARLVSMDSVIEDGRRALEADPELGRWLDGEIAKGQASDICVILYTSGTTGRPKGVQIASGRAIAAATDSIAFDRLTEREEVLAYLPLAWAGDHYLTYIQSLVAGYCISCPESGDTIAENLREIGPTFYIAPPRIFENLLTQTVVRMENAGWAKRWLFRHFTAVARRHGERILNRERAPLGARLQYALGRFLVYGPLLNEFGFSRIRVAYTAGEAIGPDLFSFYRSIGMNLKQFYGQTEAFIYLTAQSDGESRPDTVGRVVPHVDLRLADSGEVQFKSPGQFISYLKDPAKTAEALTEDGYVRTGDAGFFDRGGHLHIVDRAKDVGRLKNGALFAPKFIENKLKFFPNIREAVAFGDGRDFVTCLLNIDLTSVGSWAERAGVTYASYQELAGNERVYELLAAHIAEVNRDLAAEEATAAAQIRRFLILHKELDADDGELTRTQKLRRGFIGERYQKLADALYDGAREVDIATEVMFEDGRKGMLSGRLKIRDVAPARQPAGLAA